MFRFMRGAMSHPEGSATSSLIPALEENSYEGRDFLEAVHNQLCACACACVYVCMFECKHFGGEMDEGEIRSNKLCVSKREGKREERRRWV